MYGFIDLLFVFKGVVLTINIVTLKLVSESNRAFEDLTKLFYLLQIGGLSKK